jgi:leader peptidase (prepilin peptidase)/N-methyltransferase
MLYALYAIIYVLIFAIGAAIGSFLNVLIYRLPRRISFVKGFSYCPSCEHRLYPKDLVPIFSYLFLKGRCRYCKESISPRYPIIEAITGAIALLCYVLLSPQTAALFFAVGAILLTITRIDADTQEIPDSLNIAILLLGIAAIWIGPEISILSRAIGFFAVSVPLLLISLIISGAFGGGDIKLMAAAGFLMGWQNTLVAFFIALILGGGYGIILLAGKKKGRKDHFAFGPCLAIGIYVSMFVGEKILGFYLAAI